VPGTAKHAVATRTTPQASRDGRQVPRRDFIPVAAYQNGAASVAVRGLALRIVHIAGVDVPKACVRGDAPRMRSVCGGVERKARRGDIVPSLGIAQKMHGSLGDPGYRLSKARLVLTNCPDKTVINPVA